MAKSLSDLNHDSQDVSCQNAAQPASPPQVCVAPLGRSKRSRRTRRSAFTLMEVLLVLVIIVVIAGLVGPNLIGLGEDAKADATAAQARKIEQAVEIYRVRNRKIPESLEDLSKPSEVNGRKTSVVMKEIPNDAWDNPFEYSVNGNTYEIRSPGSDGQANTDDDVVIP